MANVYYSGQGSLFVAVRDANGDPMGYEPLGNVPNLELSIETTKFEHKESESGSRAIDVTIVQEKKGTFTMTLESLTLSNLAMAMWGEDTANVAAVGATVTLNGYLDKSQGLPFPAVSNVVIEDSATGLVTYEFGTAVGTTATPAGSLNGWVDEVNGSIHIFTAAEQTARSATANITDAESLDVTYDYAANTQMDALTVTSMQRRLRFEGLNTIDGKAVIVDLFKADLDPLTGYGLINEELSSIEVSGSLLYDPLQSGSSKFFKQINVD